MVTAKINGTAVNIPQRFMISEWCHLQKMDFDSPQQWPKILQEVTGISADTYREADPESLQLFIGFIIAAMNARQVVEVPDFNAMKFGTFVDLDIYITFGVDKHLEDITKTLGLTTPWASEALYAIERFAKWRLSIYRKYSGLFNLDDKGIQEADDDQPIDGKQVARGWYNVIVDLAGEDILNMDRVTEEPLEKVLTFLQIKKEKALAIAQEARKLKQKL